jgi:hypothetical protein
MVLGTSSRLRFRSRALQVAISCPQVDFGTAWRAPSTKWVRAEQQRNSGWPVVCFSTMEQTYPGMPILNYEKYRVDEGCIGVGPDSGRV